MSEEKEKQTKLPEVEQEEKKETPPEHYLPDGTPVNFDLHKITRKEFLALSRGEMDDEESLAVMGRVMGLKVELFDDLPWDDWKRLLQAFYRAAHSPMPLSPNSASGSTSE